MKKILVPTDFSSNANQALDYAVQLALATKASIGIVHVLDRTQNLDVEKLMLPYNVHSETLREVTEQLNLLKTAALDAGVQTDWDIYHGAPADSILQAIEDVSACMLIMGTLGRTGTLENFFGSVTAQIISQANIPVLAIPMMASWEIPNPILLAIKNFEEAEPRLGFVIEMARTLSTPVHLCMFTDEDDDDVAEYIRKKTELEWNHRKLAERFPEITWVATPVYGHHFEETINDYITSNNNSMLVMITHKRSFWDRILRPSHTQKMSYHTHIPLLSIPV